MINLYRSDKEKLLEHAAILAMQLQLSGHPNAWDGYIELSRVVDSIRD